MDEREFERHRPHLRAVAYRMLGSLGDAEDVVQEAWFRLDRTGAGEIENLAGWLTTRRPAVPGPAALPHHAARGQPGRAPAGPGDQRR